MNQLKVFKNELFELAVKLDNGEFVFDVEHVAKCLGIVQTKNDRTFVRWERVNEYLPKYSPQVGKGDFIPEPLVYKLAFKASNDVAEKFQDWLAIEVLPSIRKHGTYMTEQTLEKALTNPDFLIQLATNLKEEKTKRLEAEKINEVNRPKVFFAEALESSSDSILINELAKLLKQNGVDIGEKRLFTWLRENSYLVKQKGESYNLPTQKSMDLGVMDIKKGYRGSTSEGVKVTRTPKITGKGQMYFINKFLEEIEVLV